MALDAIKKGASDHGEQLDLMDLLPSHEHMTWMYHPSANASTALVIGRDDCTEILAFAANTGEDTPGVSYSTRSLISDDSKDLTQKDVMELPLFAPFKYNANNSPQGQANFTTIIQWYLLGLAGNNLPYDVEYYVPQFYEALRNIQVGQEMDRQILGADKRATVLTAGHIGSPTGLQPDSTMPNKKSTNETLAVSKSSTPTGLPIARRIDDGEGSDLGKLLRYLAQKDSQGLLEHIPDAKLVSFEDRGDFLQDALPKKLCVGYEKATQNAIFAYMRRTRTQYHAIYFYIESNGGEEDKRIVNVSQLAQHDILTPFSMAYAEDTALADAKDNARLTLLVKWYFIEAGIVAVSALKKSKQFPQRLHSALEYVAQRILSFATPQHIERPLEREWNASPFTSPLSSPPSTPSASEWSPIDIKTSVGPVGADETIINPRKRSANKANIEEERATTETVTRSIVASITKADSEDREERQEQKEIIQQCRALEQQIDRLQERHQTLHMRRRKRMAELIKIEGLLVTRHTPGAT